MSFMSVNLAIYNHVDGGQFWREEKTLYKYNKSNELTEIGGITSTVVMKKKKNQLKCFRSRIQIY